MVPLVGAVLAFGAVPSASAASCVPLAGEQVVAESRTAVVIKGGLEPERESSGNYGNGSYYACVPSVGRRIRIGSYHGGPLVEESLAAFQFAGHYLKIVVSAVRVRLSPFGSALQMGLFHETRAGSRRP